jgi:outer membrane lipoprotein-sorting protein
MVLSAVTCALVASRPAARADAAGDGVLAKLDAAANRAATLAFECDVVNQEAGKPERRLSMNVWAKGEKRLFEFTAPADLKGTKVLVLSSTQMYVYLPAFGKVRRIASHTKGAGFMGLAFSVDDLARATFAGQYTAIVASETAAEWKLVLTPRPGQETDYTKIAITAGKTNALASQLAYFDAAGKNVKTELRTGFGCEGDICTPGELKMTDNTTGSFTRLVVKGRKVNQVISDDMFSQRKLAE